MKAYDIAAVSDIKSLIVEVNLRADEGWELFGTMFISNNGLMCQWMMKEVPEGLTATDVYKAWSPDDLDDEEDESEDDSPQGADL